eukprot:11394198-Alexandrium_andersonii.AAC.1
MFAATPLGGSSLAAAQARGPHRAGCRRCRLGGREALLVDAREAHLSVFAREDVRGPVPPKAAQAG